MEIKEIPIDKIKPNTWNPNEIYRDKFNILVRHIKEEGMKQPILVRLVGDSYEIIDGFHRFKASEEANLNKINCVIIKADDEKAKKITLSMNKLRGENDPIKLEKLINDLINENSKNMKQLIEDIGFTKYEIFDIINKEDRFTTENAIKEWKDMPEFINENKMGVKTLIVHFKTQDNVDDFARLIQQTLKPTTKYIWFPKLIHDKPKELRYSNES